MVLHYENRTKGKNNKADFISINRHIGINRVYHVTRYTRVLMTVMLGSRQWFIIFEPAPKRSIKEVHRHVITI